MANNETKSIEAVEAAAAKSAKNRKRLVGLGTVIALAIIGILVYNFAIKQPGSAKDQAAVGEVDIMALTVGNDSDSTIVAAYQDIADQYSYDGASRAAYMAASGLYRQGNYEEALTYIKKFNGDDNVIASLAKGLEGDCYVNLDQLDDAIKAFDKAIKKADDNKFLTPYFLSKKAVVLAAQGKHNEAADIYEEIETKYPVFGNQTLAESRKLQQQGLANAGK